MCTYVVWCDDKQDMQALLHWGCAAWQLAQATGSGMLQECVGPTLLRGIILGIHQCLFMWHGHHTILNDTKKVKGKVV
jgi:hypothetical protein